MTDKPWFSFYGDMPPTVDYPDITLYDVLVETAEEHRRRTAYDFMGHRRTYRSVLAEVRRVAHGLWALGVRPGDRICTLLPNTPHMLVLLYAANRVGAVLGILDADSDSREVRALLSDFDPQWAVVTDEHLVGFQRVAGSRSIRGFIVTTLVDYGSSRKLRRMRRLRKRHGLNLGGLRGTVGVSRSLADDESVYELSPTFTWSSMRRLGIRSRDEFPEDKSHHAPDECCVVLYTGGTTGRSHGVMLSDRNLDAAARQMQLQGPILPGQRLLSVVPFSHGLGLSASVHAVVVSGGETLILPHYTARTISKTIRRRRPDYLVGVPAFYAALVRDRRFSRTRLAFLMGAFAGGERVSSNLHDLFEMEVRRRGGAVGIREGYGLTETVSACVITPDAAMRAGSVGIPMPDTGVRIVASAPRDANLVDVDTGEVGEICVSGPTVMMGYLSEPGEGIIVQEGEQRWLRTGDLGRMDDDGFLYFVERIGRSVRSSKGILLPGLVEEALSHHPEVKQVCVTVAGDADSARLNAHVVPINGDLDHQWMETTLRSWCMQELDETHCPSAFIFTRALPYTRLGVVDYRRVGNGTT